MNVPWTEREWRRVVVYGLGLSGISAARLLSERGVEVVAFDRRRREEIASHELAAVRGVDLRLGTEPRALPGGVDGVVVSPGVPRDRPILEQARERELIVVSEVELASLFVNGPLIGITGSNGKSTTTALTGALLRSAGYRVEVCGNIGRPLSACVAGQPGRIFVVELSSFQLESILAFRPLIAALLNFSGDHLDRHGNEESYLAAKSAIFANQSEGDVAILNADDPIVRQVAVRVRRRLFSRLEKVADGCYLEGETIVEAQPGAGLRRLFECRSLSLRGLHNLENAMAASLAATSLGAGVEGFARALAGFKGLPHRMEKVAEIESVEWLDDSKGTNVGATLKSLEGMRPGSVHLILGGQSKGTDFSGLTEAVARKAARVYLIGESAAAIREALGAPVATESCGDLETAVAAAGRRARRGEVVLLSPACASFDQYSSYAERGRHFRRLVERLEEAGGG